jgi:hypothetical protein
MISSSSEDIPDAKAGGTAIGGGATVGVGAAVGMGVGVINCDKLLGSEQASRAATSTSKTIQRFCPVHMGFPPG